MRKNIGKIQTENVCQASKIIWEDFCGADWTKNIKLKKNVGGFSTAIFGFHIPKWICKCRTLFGIQSKPKVIKVMAFEFRFYSVLLKLGFLFGFLNSNNRFFAVSLWLTRITLNKFRTYTHTQTLSWNEVIRCIQIKINESRWKKNETRRRRKVVW